VGEAAFRTAIERKGVAVEANLRGFELGLGLARGAGAGDVPAGPRPSLPPVPAALQGEVAALPAAVREIATRAVARLVDYQDEAYARRYLARLRPFLPAAGASPERVELARVVGRHLALWMTYEDAVRVAELKTRPDRFQRIRAEARAGDAVVVVTEYLKPDLDEIWGVLPDRLVRPLARWAVRRWPHGRPTLGQHIRSTTVTGYLRLRMLTWLKPLRPVSFRAREEHERMERWLAAVARCAAVDAGLGLEVARAGQLVKGYGDVRRRMTTMHEVVLADVLRALDAARTQGEEGLRVATALAARLRLLVLQGPEGEAQVAATTAATLARLAAGDAAGALAPLAG
jgi:indolepyruvate ferredoxin oxidoreductase beta subunit